MIALLALLLMETVHWHANEEWQSARSYPSPACLVALVGLLRAGHGRFLCSENSRQANSSIPAFDAMQKFFIRALAFLIGLSRHFQRLQVLWQTGLLRWMIGERRVSTAVENLQARRDQYRSRSHLETHTLICLDYSVLGIEGQSLAFAAADLFEIEKYCLLLG